MEDGDIGLITTNTFKGQLAILGCSHDVKLRPQQGNNLTQSLGVIVSDYNS